MWIPAVVLTRQADDKMIKDITHSHDPKSRPVMKISVFGVVVSCILVKVYQRFKNACCLHQQGNGITTKKRAVFILATVKLSDLIKTYNGCR
jgi:hypothetical protein